MDPFTIIALVSTVVSAGAQIKGQKDQAEAQEEANEIKSASEQMADLKARRRETKEARVARARLLQQSQATGSSGSSGEAGGLSSLQTQLGSNIAQRQGQANTANALTQVSEDLADKQLFNQTIGGLSSMAGSLAGAAYKMKE